MKNSKVCFLSIVNLLLLAGCSLLGNNSEVISSNSSISISEESKEEIDVIVLAGQSNMEGHSWVSKLYENTDSLIHAYYQHGFDNTFISYFCDNGNNKSENFVNVKVGQGYNTGSFGPEVGIAQELHEREHDRPLYIIKYALGGTNLFNQWNVDNSNSLYYYMVDYIYNKLAEFEEQNYKPVIKGFFWMQGEADSCWKEGTDSYYENLENLVTSFRDEFEYYYGDEEKGIAFVDAGISDCSTWVNYKRLNEIKKSFADSDPEKNFYFDTMAHGLKYNEDNTDYYHFDATSEIKLGKLFISTLLDNGWL